jgi:hypothetical protein
VKIERETDGPYRRWSVETHPGVEKSIALILYVLLAGGAGAALLGGLPRLLGW